MFFEGADKIGIVMKTAALTGFGDAFTLPQQVFCKGNAL